MVKNLPAKAGDVGSNPGTERCPGEGNGNPLQYSCLGDLKDRRTWQVIVHGVTKESDMALVTKEQQQQQQQQNNLTTI